MTSKPRIFAALAASEIADFLPQPLLLEASALAGDFTIVDTQTTKAEALRAAVVGFDPEILLASWRTDPLPAVLPPSLRYVSYLGGSVRRLLRREHIERGLLVTNWGSSVSRTVAEGALMLVLMCLRRAGDWNTRMHRDGSWVNGSSVPTTSLFGRRVGLHGFGNIARDLVALLQPFQVPVAAFDPYVAPECFADCGVERAGADGWLNGMTRDGS